MMWRQHFPSPFLGPLLLLALTKHQPPTSSYLLLTTASIEFEVHVFRLLLFWWADSARRTAKESRGLM
jgi:hypothetical protein